MGENKYSKGFCFTVAYQNISRVLSNEVELESWMNSNGRIKLKALWDTGATGSLIRPEIAVKLRLKSFGKILMSTPTGKDIPSNVYSVNLYLPNHTVITQIPVSEGIPNNCDMLIGMDIINLGDFAVTNFNGHTTFSFRMPSMDEINFVEHSYFIRKDGA
jgi:predicted aspartyl protease